MKTLDRQKLDVVNQTRSNIFGWPGQFTPESKPIEFDGFGNYGEFASIKLGCNAASFNSLEFEGFNHRASGGGISFNPVEFDGIKSSGKRRFARLKL